jgi:hypothetical protein
MQTLLLAPPTEKPSSRSAQTIHQLATGSTTELRTGQVRHPRRIFSPQSEPAEGSRNIKVISNGDALFKDTIRD